MPVRHNAQVYSVLCKYLKREQWKYKRVSSNGNILIDSKYIKYKNIEISHKFGFYKSGYIPHYIKISIDNDSHFYNKLCEKFASLAGYKRLSSYIQYGLKKNTPIKVTRAYFIHRKSRLSLTIQISLPE
jgi:hypothetical protein